MAIFWKKWWCFWGAINCWQPWWCALWVFQKHTLWASQHTYERTSKLAWPGLSRRQQEIGWCKLLPKCITARSKAKLIWYYVMHCNGRHWHCQDNQCKTCWASEAVFVIAWLKWSSFSLPNYCVPATRKIHLVSSQFWEQLLSIANMLCSRKVQSSEILQAEASTTSLDAQFGVVAWRPKKAKLSGVQLQSCKKFLCSPSWSTHTNSRLLRYKVIINLYQLAQPVDIDHKQVLSHHACWCSVSCQRVHVFFQNNAICNWIGIWGLCVATTGALLVHEIRYYQSGELWILPRIKLPLRQGTLQSSSY